MEEGGQLHTPAALSPGKNTVTNCIGDRMDHGADLDDFGVEKISCP